MKTPNSDRCEHGNLWHEGCTLCAEGKAPSSETERLLAGSLAIAELAALRFRMKQCIFWLEERADDSFKRAKTAQSQANSDLWRSRGAAYVAAIGKLKADVLGDAQ